MKGGKKRASKPFFICQKAFDIIMRQYYYNNRKRDKKTCGILRTKH